MGRTLVHALTHALLNSPYACNGGTDASKRQTCAFMTSWVFPASTLRISWLRSTPVCACSRASLLWSVQPCGARACRNTCLTSVRNAVSVPVLPIPASSPPHYRPACDQPLAEVSVECVSRKLYPPARAYPTTENTTANTN